MNEDLKTKLPDLIITHSVTADTIISSNKGNDLKALFNAVEELPGLAEANRIARGAWLDEKTKSAAAQATMQYEEAKVKRAAAGTTAAVPTTPETAPITPTPAPSGGSTQEPSTGGAVPGKTGG